MGSVLSSLLSNMDKSKLLEEIERSNASKSKLGLKVVSFCFCVLFLGSVLLNVYYLRNITENKNVVQKGHNTQHGHQLTHGRNLNREEMEMNLKKTAGEPDQPTIGCGGCAECDMCGPPDNYFCCDRMEICMGDYCEPL